MNKKLEKRAQIWIEAMSYLLISLIIIGAILAFIKPKIQEMQDKSILENSIKMMEEIDSTISSIAEEVPGNKRKISLELKKGNLKIDGINNKILFEINSKYEYSEPGKDYKLGDLIIKTVKKGKMNDINITLDYQGIYNITYDDQDKLKEITPSSTPYNLFISNEGGKNLTINLKAK